ncbi:hypothetical protein BC332_20139 [Capsicum chinense]|nr:hypothetical protein BC332_20139 [Capsicum chinense]
MNGLYQFLRLYSGRTVDSIELRCCFVREFPSAFTHWFQSLSRISVQSLYLSFECYPSCSRKLLKFSLEALSQSLEHLILSGCVVLSSPSIRFNSLTTLVLCSVVLTSGHLEGVLSSYSNLKKLTIDISELPSKLQLTGTVIDVVILECVGVKEIDLHAACLRTLVFKVASLMERTRSKRPPPSLKGHNRLKEVIYYGFDGSEIEMEFVVYILKCAIVLEQVFLSPRVISYFSCGPHPKANASFSEEKRNSIQQKLHGQALSSKARVVIK